MKCKRFAVAQRAARASQGVAGCLAPGCHFGSHTSCLEMYLGPTYGREPFKAPCKKTVERPQWTGQQVSLEAQHKGHWVLPLHRGHRSFQVLSILVLFVALPMTTEERSSPCHPPEAGGQGGDALPVSLPAFPSWVFLPAPAWPGVCRWKGKSPLPLPRWQHS